MSVDDTKDWKRLRITDVADFGSGDGISVAKLSTRSSVHAIPVFGGNGIAGYTTKATVQQPTVIIGRVGQKCGSVYTNKGPAWITDNALYAKRFKRPTDVHFFSLALEAARLNDVRNHNDLPLITQGILQDVSIPWPYALDEQTAIGATIADIDDLIGALERSLIKKRSILMGLLQELLTGRTRLPGFSGPWKACGLGEVLAVRHGKSQKSVEAPGGKYPILATGGEIGRTNTALYSRPSVLIGRKGTIDRPQYQDAPFWTVDTLFYTEISSGVDPKFLYYLFTTIDWRSMNEASGVPSLSASRVEHIHVELPPLDEQRAIRRTLDDSDAEIELLRRRRSKAQGIKQGMMQELLTGHTRLPVIEGVR